METLRFYVIYNLENDTISSSLILFHYYPLVIPNYAKNI